MSSSCQFTQFCTVYCSSGQFYIISQSSAVHVSQCSTLKSFCSSCQFCSTYSPLQSMSVNAILYMLLQFLKFYNNSVICSTSQSTTVHTSLLQFKITTEASIHCIIIQLHHLVPDKSSLIKLHSFILLTVPEVSCTLSGF